MPDIVNHDDPRLTWEGAHSLETTDEYTAPWRIPFETRNLFHDSIRGGGSTSTGVRIRFRSNTREIAGRFEPADGDWKVDLLVDGKHAETAPIEGKDSFAFAGLSDHDKIIELWLPQGRVFRLHSLGLSDGASLEKITDDRPLWVTYGSSITHCYYSESPLYTWPAIVAREHGLNLRNLGFSGSCHLDSLIAMLMRDTPAKYLSMCVGINISGGSLGERTFRQAIIGFVRIVREKHPTTPFAVMSPIISRPIETGPRENGWILTKIREEVEIAVQTLQDYGDEHVYYMNGLDIFGEKQAHLQPDDCHPYAEGDRVMGQRFLDQVAKVYFK
jgi:hypothetical protein